MLARLFSGILICLAIVSFAAHSAAPSSPADSWPAYGGSPGGGHFSSASQITAGNISKLEQAWVFQTPDFRAAGDMLVETLEGDIPSPPSGFQVTPILFQETLYLCSPFNRVIALDPATGVERWSYDPGVEQEKELLAHCRGVSSWQSANPDDSACSSRIIFSEIRII